MPHIATVSTELELGLVVPGGPSLPVLAHLSYAAADPWAVRVAFRTGGEGTRPVEWLFGRQLLTDGMSAAVGDGDVRVWPAVDGHGPVVHLAMASPSGSALFEIDRDEVAAFLGQTYRLVSAGSESQRVDLDAELGALLGRR